MNKIVSHRDGKDWRKKWERIKKKKKKTLEDDFHSEQLKHQSAKPSR